MKGKKDTDLVGLIPGALETMKIKKEVLDTGIAQGKELTVTMDGFGKRWLVVTCEALRNKAGQILGVITACMDVTEQVHLLLKVSLGLFSTVPFHVLQLQNSPCRRYYALNLCKIVVLWQALARERLAQMREEMAVREATEKELRRAIRLAGKVTVCQVE